MKIFNREISLKRILIISLLLLISNTVQIFILHTIRQKGDINFYRYDHHLMILVFALISISSVFISWKIINRIDTSNSLLKNLKIFVLSFLIFNILGLVADFLLLYVYNGQSYSLMYRALNMLSITIMVHIDISAFATAFLYFRQSKQTTLQLEQTEKEKAVLQSQMLQKNLEPHFLFNNLSVLSGLARKNPEQIEPFIDDFSDVYRYYLKHGKKQLVELKEELLFLKNYMNLMEKRFGNSYQIKNEIENTNGFIIPCSIQLCVENAIKHNKASEENSLLIRLSRKGNSVFITNKLNKVDFTLGTGTGNDYLKRQYQINFNKEVIFTEINSEFVVEIPVII